MTVRTMQVRKRASPWLVMPLTHDRSRVHALTWLTMTALHSVDGMSLSLLWRQARAGARSAAGTPLQPRRSQRNHIPRGAAITAI